MAAVYFPMQLQPSPNMMNRLDNLSLKSSIQVLKSPFLNYENEPTMDRKVEAQNLWNLTRSTLLRDKAFGHFALHFFEMCCFLEADLISTEILWCSISLNTNLPQTTILGESVKLLAQYGLVSFQSRYAIGASPNGFDHQIFAIPHSPLLAEVVRESCQQPKIEAIFNEILKICKHAYRWNWTNALEFHLEFIWKKTLQQGIYLRCKKTLQLGYKYCRMVYDKRDAEKNETLLETVNLLNTGRYSEDNLNKYSIWLRFIRLRIMITSICTDIEEGTVQESVFELLLQKSSELLNVIEIADQWRMRGIYDILRNFRLLSMSIHRIALRCSSAQTKRSLIENALKSYKMIYNFYKRTRDWVKAIRCMDELFYLTKSLCAVCNDRKYVAKKRFEILGILRDVFSIVDGNPTQIFRYISSPGGEDDLLINIVRVALEYGTTELDVTDIPRRFVRPSYLFSLRKSFFNVLLKIAELSFKHFQTELRDSNGKGLPPENFPVATLYLLNILAELKRVEKMRVVLDEADTLCNHILQKDQNRISPRPNSKWIHSFMASYYMVHTFAFDFAASRRDHWGNHRDEYHAVELIKDTLKSSITFCTWSIKADFDLELGDFFNHVIMCFIELGQSNELLAYLYIYELELEERGELAQAHAMICFGQQILLCIDNWDYYNEEFGLLKELVELMIINYEEKLQDLNISG